MQFGTLVFLWFLPYHVAGLVNEFGLLALAVAIAIPGSNCCVEPPSGRRRRGPLSASQQCST